MSAWTRQHWMVAALVLLLTYLVWSRLIAPSIGGGEISRVAAVRRAAQDHPPMVVLRADLLEADAAVYKKGRNVFAYQKQPAKPKPAPKPTRQEPPKKEARPANPQPQRPQLPTLNLSYLGSFGPRNRPIAVFQEGEDLYNVRVGDTVKNEFVLVQVGFESADLGYVNFPKEPPETLAITGS